MWNRQRSTTRYRSTPGCRVHRTPTIRGFVHQVEVTLERDLNLMAGQRWVRVIVASNLPVEQALSECCKRWRIECLFRHLKTGGFRLDETHMIEHDKLERLLCVLVVAYLCCTLLGQPKPIRIKTHGRPARAVFLAGFKLLTRGLEQTEMLLEQFV